MTLALTDIRERVRDYYTVETLTDDQLDRYIASGVRYYSNYNPDEVKATITLIDDQQDYALPTDVLLVEDVEWYPGGTWLRQPYVGPAVGEVQEIPRKHHVADRVMEKIDDSAQANAGIGKWDYVQVAGVKKLRLWDTPTSSGDTITYFYWRVHPLNVGGTGYDYIPSEDLDILGDLTTAEILQSKLVDVATEFDYAEGLQKTTKHFVPENVRTTIQQLRDSVKGKYAPVLGAIS